MKDNQYGQGNYYSTSGTALNYYDLDGEYGLSGLDQEHKIVLAAIK